MSFPRDLWQAGLDRSLKEKETNMIEISLQRHMGKDNRKSFMFKDFPHGQLMMVCCIDYVILTGLKK